MQWKIGGFVMESHLADDTLRLDVLNIFYFSFQSEDVDT